MTHKHTTPTHTTNKTYWYEYIRAGQFVRVMELFEEMQKEGVEPGTTTYNIVIKSLGEEGRLEEMDKKLAEMKEAGLLPNIVTYTTLVDAYGKAGYYGHAVGCLEAMKSDGLRPTRSMYNALINAYAQRVCSC